MSEVSEEGTVSPAPAPKKSSKIGVVVVVVVVAAAAAAGGAFLGPKYLAPGKAAKAPGAAAGEPAMTVTVAFQPIVVDIRGQTEEIHHLKVTLTFELEDQVKAEDFEKYTPRGREAAIVYLRTRTFDDVTNSAKFTELVAELNERVVTAIGKQRVRRMIITDFVTQ